MAERADIRIGISGWTYTPWRGNFYPSGLRQKDELRYAAGQFNALEINGTFYGMQVPQNFARWASAVPDDFVFAVKGPRYLTHMLQLTRIEAPLANFFASGPLALGHKLGPILWQFPARFAFDPDRLRRFFDMLPRTHAAAARLATHHDHRLRAAPHLDIVDDLPIRHAIEIRHPGFREPRFIDLLRRHDVALVCADTVDWPLLMDLTADFAYCRLHGSTELYKSRYSRAEIERWARRVAAWAGGRRMADGNFVVAPLDDGKRRDVYMFFDNTDKLQAPDNARELMRALHVIPGARTIGAAA
ncbi:MAG: hypothetical protein BGO82_01390 [Devosia sp. 67-54]|uniref:DUF72 domain-containing protein n=1 Tax=unclassified Devosia TaxID=196773 RepID=UPI00095C6D8F|nr:MULTISPECIES: DUF72 domain-containing protein [unclassified Devosia]MBN9305883.1 DUF72 domain-containing protein [Devosia sp.]OJX16423.1 MAG: hypothetical protein BGO82_01390 [Devosia sp. 67-54]